MKEISSERLNHVGTLCKPQELGPMLSSRVETPHPVCPMQHCHFSKYVFKYTCRE
jgi:hypothetical protein